MTEGSIHSVISTLVAIVTKPASGIAAARELAGRWI
jgi:hypothetical protein